MYSCFIISNNSVIQKKMSTYNEIEELGRGTFGRVYLCERKHNKTKIVVKEIDIHGENEQLVAAQNEVRILRTLSHPNVCRYYDSFKRLKVFYIVMEYCRFGNLYSSIKERHSTRNYIEVKYVVDIFCQIILGLHHIHSKKIIHRDLKTENIFLTGAFKNVVKIGDFGVSKILTTTDQTANTVIGTTNYLTPEMCNRKPYTIKSDVWCLGCILYELCALERLFDGSISDVVAGVKSVRRKSIDLKKYGKDLQYIIEIATNIDPLLRPNTENLMAYPVLVPRMTVMTVNLGNIINKESITSERRTTKKNYKSPENLEMEHENYSNKYPEEIITE